jgi:hypothetical protein
VDGGGKGVAVSSEVGVRVAAGLGVGVSVDGIEVIVGDRSTSGFISWR